VRIAVLLLLTLAGCSHAPKRPPLEEMAFPFGVYQHKITVLANGKRLALTGVLENKPAMIRVVGLSPVGTTSLRVQEDLLTHNLQVEVYDVALKEHENRIPRLYEMVRSGLFARKGDLEFQRQDAKFILSKADARGIPHLIEIHHPRMDLTIEVLSYAP